MRPRAGAMPVAVAIELAAGAREMRQQVDDLAFRRRRRVRSHRRPMQRRPRQACRAEESRGFSRSVSVAADGFLMGRDTCHGRPQRQNAHQHAHQPRGRRRAGRDAEIDGRSGQALRLRGPAPARKTASLGALEIAEHAIMIEVARRGAGSASCGVRAVVSGVDTAMTEAAIRFPGDHARGHRRRSTAGSRKAVELVEPQDQVHRRRIEPAAQRFVVRAGGRGGFA